MQVNENIQIRRGERKPLGQRFAVISAEFNKIYCERLVLGATAAFQAHGVDPSDIEIIWVPGSYELPLIAKVAAESGNFSGIVALGVLIKGDTDHYHHVATEACSGLTRVMLDTGLPVGLGIIPALNTTQVEERSQFSEEGFNEGNKGWESACAVLEASSLIKQLREQ